MQEPPKGIVTDAKVVNVVDGDTIDLKIEKTIRVRLKDCWCAETRTGDLEEKEKGLAAKHHIEDLLGKRVLYYGRKKFNKKKQRREDPPGLSVTVYNNNVEGALRIFKKKIKNSNLFLDYVAVANRMHYRP